VNEEGKTKKYVCGLVKLNGQIFMDATAEENPDPDFLFIKARTIMKVSFGDKKITVQTLADSWLKDQFLNGKLKVDHVLKDDDVILTASTKDLQAFIAKIANQKEAFSNGSELTRIK
jgi:hypothetical protein